MISFCLGFLFLYIVPRLDYNKILQEEMPVRATLNSLPIRSGIYIFSVRLIQGHSCDDVPCLHPNPCIDTHITTSIKRQPNLADSSIPNSVAAISGVLTEA